MVIGQKNRGKKSILERYGVVYMRQAKGKEKFEWRRIKSNVLSWECTIDFLPCTQDTHDFFTTVKKCVYLPSAFGEQLDFESKPDSSSTLLQGAWPSRASVLLGDLWKEQAIHYVSCLHLCSHYNRNSDETHTHACMFRRES